MASVSVAPTRDNGSTEYFCATSCGDEPQDRIINLEKFEVDGGDAVLAGKNRRDHVIRDEAQLDKVIAQSPPMFR